jgi:hypothetical protein
MGSLKNLLVSKLSFVLNIEPSALTSRHLAAAIHHDTGHRRSSSVDLVRSKTSPSVSDSVGVPRVERVCAAAEMLHYTKREIITRAAYIGDPRSFANGLRK